MVMKPRASMPAGEFKAKCLAVLDEVKRSRQSVLVTKRGKPVARVVPVEGETTASSLQDSVLLDEDIVTPMRDLWQTK
jgi:prevent-host-death family protein